MYQLILTDEALLDFSSLYHVQPPLRSLADREGLREAVRSGVISAIASHHQPHKADRSEEHTSELQSRPHLVCRLLLEKKKQIYQNQTYTEAPDHSQADILPLFTYLVIIELLKRRILSLPITLELFYNKNSVMIKTNNE